MGIWAEGGRDIAFLLEYDTGTEHLPQLAGKLPGYADLARDPGGQAFRIPILFCFPTARRELTARNALAATRASRDLQIATAALDPRVTSPAGRVWMPLHDDHGQMRLIDLVDVLSDPWLRYRQEEARKRREAAERDQAAYLDDQDDEDFGIAR